MDEKKESVDGAVNEQLKENHQADAQDDKNKGRLDMLLDVPLDISVELGRSRMTIQELLSLHPGSVIEMDKLAGEPLDVMVNNRLVARGEAVVVSEKFGIRITDIVSPTERIARLR